MIRRIRRGALALFLLLLSLYFVRPVAAHANLTRSEPAADTNLSGAPTEVRLWFSEQPELRYSEIAVYDEAQQRYDTGTTRSLPGEPLGLAITLRPLPTGIYTVVWKTTSAVDGHTTSGSFAFGVGQTPVPTSARPAAGNTTFTPPSPAEVVVKWLLLLTVTAYTGALALWWLVWRPAIRRDSEAANRNLLQRAVARRLHHLALVALGLLWVTTVVGLLLQVAKVTGKPVWQVLVPGTMSGFLVGTRAGMIWSVRLLLPLVALAFLGRSWPALARPVRSLVCLALGCGYLGTISLSSHSAASPLWPRLSIALDWLHLLATSVWVGGLFGLGLTLPLLRHEGIAGGRPPLFAIVGRFSTLALASVVLLTLTGLYSAWLQVGSLDALLVTSYGRTLLVKLVLVAGLVLLGAVNRFWLQPRLRARGNEGTARREQAAGRFGLTVRAEVFLGLAVLLTVALLTGFVPAREALILARAPKTTQTARAGDLQLTLTLGSLQPGENSFDVLVRDARSGRPVADAQRVTLRITMLDMDMGESEAIAIPRGNGHYTTSGPYLAMSGHWETRVIVRRAGLDDVDAPFRLAIGAVAGTPVASTPVPPRLPTLPRFELLAFGLALVGVGLLGLSAAQFVGRYGPLGTGLFTVVPMVLVIGAYLAITQPWLDARAPLPTNPVPADAASIARGQQLFTTNCASCHGATGRGDGPAAATLDPRPADLTNAHMRLHADGTIFQTISDGVSGSAMPAWKDRLSETDRWDLVNYLRTLEPGGTSPAPSQTGTPATPSR